VSVYAVSKLVSRGGLYTRYEGSLGVCIVIFNHTKHSGFIGYMASFIIKENIHFATTVYVFLHVEFLHVMQINCNFLCFKELGFYPLNSIQLWMKITNDLLVNVFR